MAEADREQARVPLTLAGPTLDEIAREGARRMLTEALEAEVADYIKRHQVRDESGRANVVRNGNARPRKVTLGSGTIDSCDSAEGCLNEAVTCTAPDACTISMCAPDTGACVDAPVQCDPGQECNPENGQCEDTGGSGCGAEGDTCETVIPQSVCDEFPSVYNLECGITQSGVCSVNLGCVIPTSGCNMPLFESCEAIGFGGCCANGAFCYLMGDPTCEALAGRM